MIMIIEPATDFDLTTLATVRAELGIADRAEDENLARWIRQASDAIARYCNRTFAQETVAETFRLKWREEGLLLSRFPVMKIVSITENGTELAASDYELAHDGGAGVLTRLCGNREWMWPIGTVVVTYTAGYASVRDLPPEIEAAAIALVKQYRYAAQRDPLLRSEQTDGVGSSSYFTGLESSGLSPEVLGALSKHRKPVGA